MLVPIVLWVNSQLLVLGEHSSFQYQVKLLNRLTSLNLILKCKTLKLRSA